jgi:hypothetical protein
MPAPSSGSAPGTVLGGFTLSPGLSEPDAARAMSRWLLRFRDDAFEDDFARFRNVRHIQLKVALPLIVLYVVLRTVLLSGFPDPAILYINIGLSVFEVSLLAAAVFLVFLARRDDDSFERQTAIAWRHELIGAIAIAALGTVNGCTQLLMRQTVCRASGPSQKCAIAFWGVAAGTFAWLHHVMRVQLRVCVVVDGAITAVTLGTMISVGGFAAMDVAFCTFLLLTCLAVAVVLSYIAESAERKSFVDYAELLDASTEIEEYSATTRLLVESVMPRELVESPAMAARTHRVSDATVGVCDIADFATWSCGLLIGDVVVALHELMCTVDVGADLHGILRAMTYGDSSTVCAGLLSECGDHAVRVAGWGDWLLHRGVAAKHGCRYRVCVESGALSGSLVGSDAKRFALSGPALDAARTGLRVTAAGAVTVQPRVPISTPPEPSVMPVPLIKPDSSTADIVVLNFSAFTLRFNDAAAQAGMDTFVADREERTRVATAAMPVAVFGALLAVMQLERASPDAGRHHSETGPMVGLASAVVLGLLVMLLRWRTALPVAVDYALTAVCIAGGILSAGFSDCVWVFTGGSVCALVLGTPTLFGRLPWLGQVALQGIAVMVPIFAVESFAARREIVSPDADRVFGLIGLTSIVVYTRYFSVRVASQQYVGSLDAAAAAQASAAGAVARDGMLRGLLPAHVPIDAVIRGILSAAKHRQIAVEHVRRSWTGLSVLQVECRRHRYHHTADLTALWADVAPTIQIAGGGILEMVEAAGDVFLVAGPFDASPTDTLRRLAASNSVALMRALRTLFEKHCAFTAVATAGSAYGALLGSSGLTYRLFGAVVRESNALLAAAPANAAGPAAFAAEGFRRQHANFGVSARPAKRRARMSIAVLSTCADVTASALGFDAMAETDDFRAAARWRMRGVGVVMVSGVKL